MNITDSVLYIGVNDHAIDLFEGQYVVPNGMAYNSYAIIDDKIAIMDTVDIKFTEQWLKNIESALNGKKPDYLVIQHMEPDHSANIHKFLEIYTDTTVVASSMAFNMMDAFFGADCVKNRLIVAEGDTISLGKRDLTFITAPMVHWPEVIVTYDSLDKILFSADGFGKFGALDVDEDWACEARRYYFGIVGKYGSQVQTLLKKASAFDIRTICPLHGPVLKENLDYYINLYNIWSSYAVEEAGVVIVYTSVYGNTQKAVLELADLLRAKDCSKVAVYDLARCDMTAAVADAFRYGKLVLATTTYNGGIFPFMQTFIHHLTQRGYCSRTVAFVENGSWAPVAIRTMKSMLEKSKGLTFAQNDVTISCALSAESTARLAARADELCPAE